MRAAPGPRGGRRSILIEWILALLVLIGLVYAWSRGRGARSAAARAEPAPRAAEGPDPIEEVVLPIEDAFDLHTFQPREIPAAVLAYLEAAREAGFAEVRLIHGRGKGFQRERVRELLREHRLVAAYHDAPPERGGWGATIVHFKK